MDYWIFILLTSIAVLDILLFYKVMKKREREKLKALKDLFGKLVCETECLKCGFKARKEWVRGDYMMREIPFKHFATQVTEKKLEPKKNLLTVKLERKLCDGKTIISGIYVFPLPMTKEELKYRQLCDKWR